MSLAKRIAGLATSGVCLASILLLRRWRRGRLGSTPDAPAVGFVDFGNLRRLSPLSREWGDDRGGPIDRHYIESFMAANRRDVRGRVLEIAEDVYASWFGKGQTRQIDILEYVEGEHPRATFVGDLVSADHIPSNAFDCVIVTQTLQLIYDIRPAIGTIHRILKPGGVALVTVPGISQINRQDSESWGDYWCWNFTALSMRRLFGEFFRDGDVRVEAHGNVLAAAAFLYGLGRKELKRAELDFKDPDYELLITVRAQKSVESHA